MTEEKQTLSCIKCYASLENVSGSDVNQPYGGLAYRSHGAYGGTEFDPIDGSFIEFNLCDKCLLDAAHKNLVLISRDRRPVFVNGTIWGWQKVEGNYSYWNPEVPNEKDRLHLDLKDVMKYADDEPLRRFLRGDRRRRQRAEQAAGGARERRADRLLQLHPQPPPAKPRAPLDASLLK